VVFVLTSTDLSVSLFLEKIKTHFSILFHNFSYNSPMTPLKRILEELSHELSLKFEDDFDADGWTIRLSSPSQNLYFDAKTFNINSAWHSNLVKDKAATYSVLKKADIPAIPHFFYTPGEKFKIDYPLVIKPCLGQSGKNVFLCHNATEATLAIDHISNGPICYSPFVESEYEYRLFYLDGEIIYGYRKDRHGDWQHNLSHGSTPTELDQNIKSQLFNIARTAGRTIGAKFVTIDILQDSITNQFLVLEINANVSTGLFTERMPGGYEIAKEIYRKALQNLLQ